MAPIDDWIKLDVRSIERISSLVKLEFYPILELDCWILYQRRDDDVTMAGLLLRGLGYEVLTSNTFYEELRMYGKNWARIVLGKEGTNALC